MAADGNECDIVEEHDHFNGETNKNSERISIRLGEGGNEEAGHTQIQPIQNNVKQIDGVGKEGEITKYVLYDGLP